MPRSIQVGVPRGWFWVMWLMAVTVDRGTDRIGRAENYWWSALRSAHAVPLTCSPAPGPPARPAHRRMGVAGRPGTDLPAVRPAVRGLGPVRCGDLGAVRPVVRGRDHRRGPLRGARGPLRPPHARSSSVRSCRRSAMRPGSCSPSFSALRRASCCGDWAAPSRQVHRRRCCTTGWSQSVPRSTTRGSRAGSARRGWSCRCRPPGSRRHCSSPVVIPRPDGRA